MVVITIPRFNSLWEETYRHDLLLIFSMGRTLDLFKKLRKDKPLLTPDVIITYDGTEIAYGNSMVSEY
ncbi:unnamed protein product [Cochlearia groenlandica]